jgi:hypothetical protein
MDISISLCVYRHRFYLLMQLVYFAVAVFLPTRLQHRPNAVRAIRCQFLPVSFHFTDGVFESKGVKQCQ